MKWLVPDGISGAPGLEGVHNGRVDFAALDRKGQTTRIRMGATVVRIEHAQSVADGEHVVVAYEQGGKVYRTKARDGRHCGRRRDGARGARRHAGADVTTPTRRSSTRPRSS